MDRPDQLHAGLIATPANEFNEPLLSVGPAGGPCPLDEPVREQDEARYREDISVFPMAFPLIAGPGALATLLLFMVETRGEPLAFLSLLAVILSVLAVTLVLLLGTTHVMKIMGVTGANVVSRLLGVVLSALAVQYVLDGVQNAFLGV